MIQILILIFLAALGYLLGSIPFGLLLTRAAGLGDIRSIGSGNIGATNVLRTGKKGLAATTLLLDALKGVVAVLIGSLLADSPGVLAAGLGAIVGHLFPAWLGFKGGKGVATGLGVLVAASPATGIATATVWVLGAVITRTSSASALAACVAAPILAAMIGVSTPVQILVVGAAVLIIARHHANIRRLIAGTEPKIGERK